MYISTFSFLLFLLKSVLVIYCCIINQPQTERHKSTFIISPFLWVRNLGMTQLGPLVLCVSQSCNEGVGWDGHLRTWLVRICFQAHSSGCWQDLVPLRLLDLRPQFLTSCYQRLPCEFLAICASPQHSLQCDHQCHQGEQVRGQERVEKEKS